MVEHAVSLAEPAIGDDRRTAILLAVGRVIVRDGVDGLRMAAVAREAGVSSALLHYYFATREELIRQAFDLLDRRAADVAERKLAIIADSVQRVRVQLARQLSDDPDVHANWVLWTELQRLALFHEDLRATVVERSLRWVGVIAELIGETQATGRVDPAIDAADAALRLTSLVDGLGAHLLIGSVPRAEALRALDRELEAVLGL